MEVNINCDDVKQLGISLTQYIYLTNSKLQSKLRSYDLIKEEEIQELLDKEIAFKRANCIYPKKEIVKEDYFDEFYATYPASVIRPDGVKTSLRLRVAECRKLYNKITGGSLGMHHMILGSLKKQLDELQRTGNMKYLRLMYNWLNNEEWLAYKDEVENPITTKEIYGLNIE